MADGTSKRHDAALYVAKANDTDPQANSLLRGETLPVVWVSKLNLGKKSLFKPVILSLPATNRKPTTILVLGPSSTSLLDVLKRAKRVIHEFSRLDSGWFCFGRIDFFVERDAMKEHALSDSSSKVSLYLPFRLFYQI